MTQAYDEALKTVENMKKYPRVILERHDNEDGSITYEIWHADKSQRICSINDQYDNENAKNIADRLVEAWNAYGMKS